MNLLADHETSAPDEWLLERMRLRRDALLVAWALYRQALRDFPATWQPAPTVDFPERP